MKLVIMKRKIPSTVEAELDSKSQRWMVRDGDAVVAVADTKEELADKMGISTGT